MFDSTVAPILFYGCQVLGFQNNQAIESLFFQFYKIILNLKKSTPNNVLLGELGRYPVEISRIIGFRHRIISGKQDKIWCLMHRLLFKLKKHNLLSKMIKTRLMDRFKQKWYSSIYDMSK